MLRLSTIFLAVLIILTPIIVKLLMEVFSYFNIRLKNNSKYILDESIGVNTVKISDESRDIVSDLARSNEPQLHETEYLKQEERIRSLCKDFGLERITQRIINDSKYSIRLIPGSEIGNIVLGNSKMGGIPDLPRGTDWPRSKDNVPLQFVAQINLEELSLYDREKKFPASGMLYFFIEGMEYSEGRVLFSSSKDEICKSSFPTDLPEVLKFKEVKLLFYPYFSIPTDFEEYPEKVGMTPEETEGYFNGFSYYFGENDFDLNKVFGYPSIIQSNVLHENEELLLQIGSNDVIDMMWGDAGSIFYIITQEDLRNGVFNKVRLEAEWH